MTSILIEHTATIYDSDGVSIVVRPDQDDLGLIEIEQKNAHDGASIRMLLPQETALALSSVLTRIISLNAKAP